MLLRRERWAHGALLGAIVGLGFGLRAWGITWGLHNANISRRPHPDEWPVYWLTRWFDASHSLNPCPPAKGQCFFDWGTLFPYLAYAVHAPLTLILAPIPHSAYGPAADVRFVQAVIAGRVVSLLLSTATIVVAYELSIEAFGPRASLPAALIVALSGLLIQLAHFATPDSTTLFFLSCYLLMALRAAGTGERRPLVIAGVLAGVAAATEYHMVLLAIPLLTSWYLGGRKKGSLLPAVAGMAAAYLILNVYDIVDLPAFLGAIGHTLSIRTVNSGAEYGDRWAPYRPAWLYVVRFPLGFGVGFALTAWLLAGVGLALYRRARADLVLLSWVIPYFLLVTLSPAKFMRYSAPLLVPLAVLAAGFAVTVPRKWNGARLVMALAAAATIAYSGIYDAAYTGLFASADPRSVAAAWLTAHVPVGTRLGFEQLPNGLINMPYFLPAGQFRSCFDQFQQRRLDSSRYVVVDSYEAEEHPRTPTAQMRSFQSALASSGRFTVVRTVQYVPTFLGLQFPIGNSPHDWRYPAHRITIYRSVMPPHSRPAACFPSVWAATQALYIPATGTVRKLSDTP